MITTGRARSSEGDVEGAADYFAVPSSRPERPPPLDLDSREEWCLQRALPCGAELVEASRGGRFMIATFELTERPGGGECGTGSGRDRRDGVRDRGGTDHSVAPGVDTDEGTSPPGPGRAEPEHPLDHRVGELGGRGVALQVGGADAVGRRAPSRRRRSRRKHRAAPSTPRSPANADRAPAARIIAIGLATSLPSSAGAVPWGASAIATAGARSSSSASRIDSAPAIEPNSGSTRSESRSPSRLRRG